MHVMHIRAKCKCQFFKVLILLLHLHFARMCITCITCITNLKRFVSLCSKQVRASSASASQGAYKAKLCSRFVQKRGKKICSYALVSTLKKCLFCSCTCTYKSSICIDALARTCIKCKCIDTSTNLEQSFAL